MLEEEADDAEELEIIRSRKTSSALNFQKSPAFLEKNEEKYQDPNKDDKKSKTTNVQINENKSDEKENESQSKFDSQISTPVDNTNFQLNSTGEIIDIIIHENEDTDKNIGKCEIMQAEQPSIIIDVPKDAIV